MNHAFGKLVRVIFDIPASMSAGARAQLKVYLLDELDDDGDGITGEWLPLVTTIDEVNNQVWAEVPHFSIYRLGVSTVPVAGLNDVIVYPNPWRSDRHARNANPGVKILLPVNRNFEIKIYNIAGDLIDADNVNTVGGVNSVVHLWNLTNAHGRNVASGVYFIVIRDTGSGESTTRKVAIIL
ncbi:MAG TPA: T9SS type A sorting domain-containing protein, partial [bacterium]|nr:T9SS type A sorting domain-containing protein [bacterium]